jgi:hypothetical protein
MFPSAQAFQDRALTDWAATGTRANESHESRPHSLEAPHLLVDLSNFRLRSFPNVRTTSARVKAQAQQAPDFLERESEILRSLNEQNAEDGIFRKQAIARLCPRRLWQKPEAFIVTDGLHVDLRVLRQVSDCQLAHRLPPWKESTLQSSV